MMERPFNKPKKKKPPLLLIRPFSHHYVRKRSFDYYKEGSLKKNSLDLALFFPRFFFFLKSCDSSRQKPASLVNGWNYSQWEGCFRDEALGGGVASACEYGFPPLLLGTLPWRRGASGCWGGAGAGIRAPECRWRYAVPVGRGWKANPRERGNWGAREREAPTVKVGKSFRGSSRMNE